MCNRMHSHPVLGCLMVLNGTECCVVMCSRVHSHPVLGCLMVLNVTACCVVMCNRVHIATCMPVSFFFSRISTFFAILHHVFGESEGYRPI